MEVLRRFRIQSGEHQSAPFSIAVVPLSRYPSIPQFNPTGVRSHHGRRPSCVEIHRRFRIQSGEHQSAPFSIAVIITLPLQTPVQSHLLVVISQLKIRLQRSCLLRGADSRILSPCCTTSVGWSMAGTSLEGGNGFEFSFMITRFNKFVCSVDLLDVSCDLPYQFEKKGCECKTGRNTCEISSLKATRVAKVAGGEERCHLGIDGR